MGLETRSPIATGTARRGLTVAEEEVRDERPGTHDAEHRQELFRTRAAAPTAARRARLSAWFLRSSVQPTVRGQRSQCQDTKRGRHKVEAYPG